MAWGTVLVAVINSFSDAERSQCMFGKQLLDGSPGTDGNPGTDVYVTIAITLLR
jgi:hypothetical protein